MTSKDLQAKIDEIVAGITNQIANALANATANEIADIARGANPAAFRPRPNRTAQRPSVQANSGGPGVKDLVLTYLANNPGPQGLRSIASGIQRAPEYVSNVLRVLREEHKVSMEGDRRTAVYQLVGAITEPEKVLAPPPSVVQPGAETAKGQGRVKLNKRGKRAA